MSLSLRAAALAALTFCTVLIGASAPGFASELDRTVNGRPILSVPLPQTQPTPPAESVMSIQAPTAQISSVTDGPVTDAPDFASLAAAIAAQDDASIADDDADLRCLAGAIYYEAKGEPLDGQLAVGEVILNRIESGRYPKTVCAVVTQRGQFAFVRGGAVPLIAACAAYRTALAVARVAIAKAWNSPATGAMFFHARSASPGWRVIKIAAIGNHVFYR